MKKIFVFLMPLLFVLACDLEIPQSLTVVTDATYRFYIGDVKQDFNDSFSTSSLFSSLESEDNKVYDYFPGQANENLQEYVLSIKIGELSLGNFPNPPENQDISTVQLTSGTNPIEVDMDISEIFASLDVLGDEFSGKVEFSKLPIYIYCNIASGFSEAKLTGTFTFHNSSVTNGDNDKTIGSDTEEITMSSRPVLLNASGTEVTSSSEAVVTNLMTKPYSLMDDISEFANAHKSVSGNLEISYDLKFNGTFDGKEIGDLEIYAYIELPLEFKVNSDDESDLNIDLIQLSGIDTSDPDYDLFSRSEKTDTSDTKKYFDILESITINYTTSKSPIVTANSLYYYLTSETPELDEKFAFGNGSLELSNDEFMDMLESYPLQPTLTLVVPNGSVMDLPRDVQLAMNMNVAIWAKGQIEF